MSGKIKGISGAKVSPLIMPGPLLTSILGVMFCSWSAFGNSIDLCITAGCEFSQDVSLLGLSLWWYGAIAFCILTVLSLSGKPWLGIFASGLCVVIDLFLVLLMLTTAPCTNCLVAGLLFVLTYFAFRQAGRGFDPLPRSILVWIWTILFIANVGVIVRDSFGPWSIYGVSNSNVNVYFSPSCESCRIAVNTLQTNPQAAFYPVMDMDKDFDAISNMMSNISKGDDIVTALDKAQKPQDNPLSLFDQAILFFHLSCNKAKVLLSGSHVVPFIEYKGLPAMLKPRQSIEHKTEKEQKPVQSTPLPVVEPKPEPRVEPQIESTTPIESGEQTKVPTTPTQTSPDANEEEPMETIESMDPINLQNDADLPIDTGIAGSCGGADEQPCEEYEPY